jgi:putative spermidine/putrescine transport system substrate-binding protein
MTDVIEVLSWGGPWNDALRTAVSDPFECLTGVRVRHKIHVGLGLPDRLVQALSSRTRPDVDVVWCNALAAMRAARSGFCHLLDPSVVRTLTELNPRAMTVGSQLAPFVMTYSVPYVLVFRESIFRHHPPASWGALLDDCVAGKVALYPDGNGIHAIAQRLGGGSIADIPRKMSACWRFLQNLAPRVGMLAYSTELASALGRGEIDLAIRALPNAIAFRRTFPDVAWIAPREGVPDTMDALWVPRNLPAATAEIALRYVNFALTRPVQTEWCALLGALPVNRESIVPSVVEQSNLPTKLDDDRLLYIPDHLKLEYEQEWRRRFVNIFQYRLQR